MQGIRHHKESFFYTRFWIVVLFIICILLGISVFKVYLKYAHAKSIRNDYRDELAQVKQHEMDLQKNNQFRIFHVFQLLVTQRFTTNAHFRYLSHTVLLEFLTFPEGGTNIRANLMESA